MDLSDGKGHEQKGERPAIVLGKANGLVVVVPLTSNADMAKFPYTHVVNPAPENGLNCHSIALVFQLIALDKSRLKHRMGCVPAEQQAAIDCLVKDLLSLRDTERGSVP